MFSDPDAYKMMRIYPMFDVTFSCLGNVLCKMALSLRFSAGTVLECSLVVNTKNLNSATLLFDLSQLLYMSSKYFFSLSLNFSSGKNIMKAGSNVAIAFQLNQLFL